MLASARDSENPRRGVVVPDEMDYRRILDICLPYLGEVVGAYGDWTPLFDRGRPFAKKRGAPGTARGRLTL